MATNDPVPLEILVLGPVSLRRHGQDLTPPTRMHGGILQALALTPHDSYITTAELSRQCSHNGRPFPRSENAIHQHIRAVRAKYDDLIETGERGTHGYRLDRDRCRIDAWEFVATVDSADIGELIAMWRPDVPALTGPQWARVRAARSRLVDRILQLTPRDRAGLVGLERFTSLFPGDPELDPIRVGGSDGRPRLLVVDDDPDVNMEICERLKPYYECVSITEITDWRRRFRDKRANLAEMQGALVDLHLTPTLADSQGLEIVIFLRDETEVPVALVTANPPARNAYGSDKNRKEFRLVDIVDKTQDDWWRALERAANLLVSKGEEESRHRLETYLEHAYRARQREDANAAPGSVAANRSAQCRKEYGDVLRAVRVEPLAKAERQLAAFRHRWPV